MMTETLAEIAVYAGTWEAIPGIALAALVVAICIAVLVDLVAQP